MSFAVQYPGDSCADCGQELQRGQMAMYFGPEGIVHVRCPNTTICSKCFTIMPATGVCDCDD